MTGTVTEINQVRGMVAVATEEDFTIIELTEEGIEEGDQLSWSESHPQGSGTVKNLTQGRTVNVYFQNHWVSREQLRQQLLY